MLRRLRDLDRRLLTDERTRRRTRRSGLLLMLGMPALLTVLGEGHPVGRSTLWVLGLCGLVGAATGAAVARYAAPETVYLAAVSGAGFVFWTLVLLIPGGQLRLGVGSVVLIVGVAPGASLYQGGVALRLRRADRRRTRAAVGEGAGEAR